MRQGNPVSRCADFWLSAESDPSRALRPISFHVLLGARCPVVITSDVERACAAATSIVTSTGLEVSVTHVLHNSNKVTLHLMPCDVVARVAPLHDQNAQFEIDVAEALATVGCPVGRLDPRVQARVYEQDGFAITLWTYLESRQSSEVAPADYARALSRLHHGMRAVTVSTPHCSDRVESARQLLADAERTPDLPEPDRVLLAQTLDHFGQVVSQSGRPQLLHGEPHPGNLLLTSEGLVFIDLETCCRGPVEFDLAHAPDGVGELYPGVDLTLLTGCRILMLAMIITWRWDRDDQLADGRRLASEWMTQLRSAVTR